MANIKSMLDSFFLGIAVYIRFLLDSFFDYCGLHEVYVRQFLAIVTYIKSMLDVIVNFVSKTPLYPEFFFLYTVSWCTFVIRCLFPICLKAGSLASKSPCASGMGY